MTARYPMLSEDRLLPPRKAVPTPSREQDQKNFQHLIKQLTVRRESSTAEGKPKQFTCSDLTAKGANVKKILMRVCPDRFKQAMSPRIIERYEPLKFPSPRIDRIEKQISDKMREMRAKEAQEKEAKEALKHVRAIRDGTSRYKGLNILHEKQYYLRDI